MKNDKPDVTVNTLKTEYILPENCKFFASKNGFLGAEIDGKEYRRVILTRSLPLTQPDEFICISDVEKNELGIIENVSCFDAGQIELIRKELGSRYYCPLISQVISIKEKFGQLYFEVKIGETAKNFTVRDVTKNIRYHGEGFDIIDVDGNRYCIENFKSIPAKTRRKIEPYLY